MNALRILALALFVGAVSCLASCGKKEETPATKLNAVSTAATNAAKDTSGKAKEAAKDAAGKAKDAAKEASAKTKEAAKDAKKKLNQ